MWQQTKFVSHSYKNVEKIFPLKQHTVEELIEHCKALERVLFKRRPGRESGPGGPPWVYPGCWLTGPAGRGTR